MGLIDQIRNRFSPNSPKGKADAKLRLLLRAALEIVTLYRAVLERQSESLPSPHRSQAELPFTKKQIAQAIALLQLAIRQCGARAILVEMLSSSQAQQVLSKQFEKDLATGFVMLDTFEPISEAEAEGRKMDEAV
jgi:hypothetical protein